MVVHIVNTRDKQESMTLEILEAIESRSDVTQRRLAERMDVALGLANSYLKRCVRKGWVKIQQAPANRYLYYLTPAGFSEKSRLTAEYLSTSFNFYRKAGDSCRAALRYCQFNGWRRLVLYGVSDLAEIASLRALEDQIEIVGIFDPFCEQRMFLNRVIARSVDECEAFDACVLTYLRDPKAAVETLMRHVPSERIIVPSILGLKLNR